MSWQSKANKDSQSGEELLEDIHIASRMPTLQWLLAEQIYTGLAKRGLVVYKIGIFPPFDKLEPIYRTKYLDLAKEIMEGKSDGNKRQSRKTS